MIEFGIEPVRSDGVLIGMTRGGHKLIVSLYVDGAVPAMLSPALSCNIVVSGRVHRARQGKGCYDD